MDSVELLDPFALFGPYLEHPNSDLGDSKAHGKLTEISTSWARPFRVLVERRGTQVKIRGAHFRQTSL